MLIGILSDSHDNLPNTIKALQHLISHGVTTLIHCGDICMPDTLEVMAQQFTGAIHIAFGNGDYEEDKLRQIASQYQNITIHGQQGILELNGCRIAWCHYPEQADKLASTGEYDVVFYGHTHTPWEKKVDNCMIRNPGTVAGQRNKATFALFDTKTRHATLVLLEKISTP